MSSAQSMTTAWPGTTWNGPVCPTCGLRYLGSHTCSHEDIVRRINELLDLLRPTPQVRDGLHIEPPHREGLPVPQMPLGT